MEKFVKVKALIRALQRQDPETLVALSADSEGNSFSLMPLNGGTMGNVYLEAKFGSQEDYVTKDEYDKATNIVKPKYGEIYEKKDLVKVIILFGSN